MTLEILGCYGNIIGDYRATAFLINGSVLLDAGTVTEVLDDEQLKKIKHILISHTHIDHLKGLFPFVDELVMMGSYSFELISTAEILSSISDNLFNDLIWPDFTAIPSEARAIMKLRDIEANTSSMVGGLSVGPIPVSHTVACVGYIIKEDSTGFMYTADTGLTERFWELAREVTGHRTHHRRCLLSEQAGEAGNEVRAHDPFHTYPLPGALPFGPHESIHNPYEANLSQGDPF